MFHLMNDSDIYAFVCFQDITVHEFAHSLHLLGFNHVFPKEFPQEATAD
jgi:ssRNA-specific RNase YbeY (16S rRNA maturation enzyme)